MPSLPKRSSPIARTLFAVGHFLGLGGRALELIASTSQRPILLDVKRAAADPRPESHDALR